MITLELSFRGGARPRWVRLLKQRVRYPCNFKLQALSSVRRTQSSGKRAQRHTRYEPSTTPLIWSLSLLQIPRKIVYMPEVAAFAHESLTLNL
jgi:hypothetical protein